MAAGADEAEQRPDPGVRLVDAVLPLTERDLPRFRSLLEPTMTRSFRDLGTCWVVTPSASAETIATAISDPRFRVLDEADLLPEIRLAPKLRYIPKRGWLLQQLVKLAVAERVEHEFYLTLDADVICVKPTSYDDLVVDGRAYAQEAEGDEHPKWNRWADRVLGLSGETRTFNVTPAVLSRQAVLDLAAHLERRIPRRYRWAAALASEGSDLGATLGSWRGHLLRKLPWTEYRLYYRYLELTGTLDRYHVVTQEPRLHANSVWHVDDFEAWDAEKSFSDRTPAHFTVVQSTTGIPPEEIADRLGPLLGGRRP